jgi:RNA polymerase sigma-70 factor, ECF subfamily
MKHESHSDLDDHSPALLSTRPLDLHPGDALNTSATTSSLISEALSGDREALAELLARHRTLLLGMTRRRLSARTRTRVESQDILQEVLTEAVLHLSGCAFRREREFFGWLKKIVCNKIRDHGRSVACSPVSFVEPTALDAVRGAVSPETPSESLIRQEDLERLDAALLSLPQRQADVIRMRDIEGLEYEEVATRLALPSSAAARMMRRRAWVALTRQLERRENGAAERRGAAVE